ncbi:hypothetical protein B0H11DRAFT_2251756 [Mycena galericulata]|nr:hypothetical protein B0H11DRAFT_2251756 [Mycena galericulata]
MTYVYASRKKGSTTSTTLFALPSVLSITLLLHRCYYDYSTALLLARFRLDLARQECGCVITKHGLKKKKDSVETDGLHRTHTTPPQIRNSGSSSIQQQHRATPSRRG